MNLFDFSNYQKLSFFSGKDLIEKSGLINQLQRLLEIFEILPSDSYYSFEEFSSFFTPEIKKEDYIQMSSSVFLEIVENAINRFLKPKIHQ